MQNLGVITKVLAKFETQAERDLASLQQSIAGGDASATAKTAHALKGAAAIVAAEQLSSIAAEIERHGRQEQLSDLSRQLEQLKAETEKCLAYLPQGSCAGEREVVRQVKGCTCRF